MAKFHGVIGYAVPTEIADGVWVDVITEKTHCGDTVKNTSNMVNGEGLNDNLNINNLISILADPYACQNFHSMRYISWMGALWKITKVDVIRPRLILTVGGVYNGPIGSP